MRYECKHFMCMVVQVTNKRTNEVFPIPATLFRYSHPTYVHPHFLQRGSRAHNKCLFQTKKIEVRNSLQKTKH